MLTLTNESCSVNYSHRTRTKRNFGVQQREVKVKSLCQPNLLFQRLLSFKFRATFCDLSTREGGRQENENVDHFLSVATTHTFI